MTQPLHSSLQGTLHDCASDCAATVQGHGLAVMQERLAAATPSNWSDAVVVTISPAGWVEVASLADDSVEILWHHADLTGELHVGDPVAVHSVYDVLAVGTSKYNVLRVAAL